MATAHRLRSSRHRNNPTISSLPLFEGSRGHPPRSLNEEEDDESVFSDSQTPRGTTAATATPSSSTCTSLKNKQKESRTTSQGLPLYLQRQLATDIQAAGGIKVCNLQRLCNLKPDIYGGKGSATRQQVQNKVDWWKIPTI